MDEDGNANIYEDLPDFRYDKTLDQLNASIAKLEAENHVLQSKLIKVLEEKKVLEASCSVLNTNISSLLKTAKLEIKRKERTIVELREQLNKVMPHKKQFGVKRPRETVATPSPRKKPRFSPRKVREERLPSRRIDVRRDSKPVETNRYDKSDRDEVPSRDERPTPVERERRDRSVSEKENAPVKDAVVKEPQGNGNSVAACENKVVPSLTIAAPSLPALECPTLFSSRMYKRLYGRDRDSIPKLTSNSAGSPQTIHPPAVFDEPPKPPTFPESEKPPSHNSGSSKQRTSSYLCSRVTPENIGMYLGADPFISDSSSSNSSVHLGLEPISTSYVEPQNCNVRTTPKLTEDDLKLELHQRAEPPTKNEVPNHQPPEPPSVPLIPCEKPNDIPSKVKVKQSSAKSPVAKVGLLAVGKARQQMVAAIRPIQKIAAQETPTIVEKFSKTHLIESAPNSSIENSPESKISETNTSVRGAEKSSRLLKIPGLAGSAKGRPVRQVFAPISNQWNNSLPTSDNTSGTDKNVCNEVPVGKTDSVTSELTVRVEDPKLDELKLTAEAMFGSPVKWADDSVDSPLADGSSNSRKLYSIFGSPLKMDSNSSEHPFSVPPGAYEDSCWTNQVPEKVPTNSSVREESIKKQSQRSQEPGPAAETKPKEKSLELKDAEKVSTASSICPPPPLSVIKKHVSIFSPSKDTTTSNMTDEPSRSNTGICFPFPRPRYEDSVLGQFDDTAQFVSALAKVDSKISPLSTPIKSGEGSNHTQSVIVEKNLTSFQQVFKRNSSEEGHQIHEPPNPGNDAVGDNAAENPNLSRHSQGSLNEHSAGIPNHFLPPNHSSNDIGNASRNIGSAENPQPQSTVETPTITITPPTTRSSLRLIHRPNFASSTILGVKSWFPNAPVKIVTPRKTPRLVSGVKRSASPKGLEVSVGAKIAINDAFIIEQEERVRRWELDHLYENTIRSGSGSPLKIVNGSPTRKRIESPGKISPPKRSPKKQVSPCKSPRPAELNRKVRVEQALQCPPGEVIPVSTIASNQETSVNRLVPSSANQKDLVPYSADAISSQISTEPIKSLPNSTQKLLTMLNAVITQTRHTEPGFESSSAETNQPEAKVAPTSVESTNLVAKSQVEDKDTVVDNIKSCDRVGPGAPSTSTLEHEILPSQVTVSDHSKSCSKTVGEEVYLKHTSEQALLVNPPDSAVLCRVVPPDSPLPFNNKSLPTEAIPALKETIPESSDIGSVDPTVSTPGSFNVTDAKATQILTGRAKPSTEVNINNNKKRGKPAQTTNHPTDSMPIASSKPNESTPSSDHTKSNGRSIAKRVPTKYAALISIVKPSTPLNKAVAALITSSVNSPSTPLSRPRQNIIVQSTKKCNFKRSSALKCTSQNGAGSSLMNSIRSTFFQGAPTSSAKAENFGAQTHTPKPTIHPRLIHRKSESNLGGQPPNKVTQQSTTHSSDVTPSRKNSVYHKTVGQNDASRFPAKTVAQDEVALSTTAIEAVEQNDLALCKRPAKSVAGTLSKEPGGMESNFPGQWKLLEVDHPTKPISLLQRFKESNKTDDLLDPERKETSNAQTGNNAISANTHTEILSPVLNGAVERAHQKKPETRLIPKSEGVKLPNRDNAKLPPKSPVFPRSSSRKTILLDSPLKMEAPTKRKKRSGESDQSPKPKEKCGESIESPKSKEKCGESIESPKSKEDEIDSKSGEKAKMRAASGGRVMSSPKKFNKKYAEPMRRRYTESRRRSVSRSLSPRKSVRTERDVSSKPRNKSRCTYDSPDISPARHSGAKHRYDRSHRKGKERRSSSSRSSDRKSKSSLERASRKSDIGFSESSDKKSKTNAPESSDRKSKSNAPESSDRKSKTNAPESSDKKSKTNAPESSDRKPKTSSSDSAYRPSKISSSGSVDEKSKITHAVNDTPVLQTTAPFPRAPLAAPNHTSKKVDSPHPQNFETPRQTEFRSSVVVTSSTPRIHPRATPNSGPSLVVPGNRRLNFSNTPAAKSTEIVICVGERPALFRPT